MTICDDGHKEVCYEGRSCPACEIKDERDELKVRIADLETQLDHALANQE